MNIQAIILDPRTIDKVLNFLQDEGKLISHTWDDENSDRTVCFMSINGPVQAEQNDWIIKSNGNLIKISEDEFYPEFYNTKIHDIDNVMLTFPAH